MPLWLNILLGAGSATAAIASAFAAWKALSISRGSLDWAKSREAPRVIVRVLTMIDAPTLIYIRAENVGNSVAYDVKFSCSETLYKAFGLEGLSGEKEPFDGFVKSGIPALGPADSRTVLWGQFGGLHSWLGDRFIKIVTSYRDEHGRRLESTSVVEVQSFDGSDASDNRPITKIAKGVDRISKSFDHLARSGAVVVENRSFVKRKNREYVATIRKNRPSS